MTREAKTKAGSRVGDETTVWWRPTGIPSPILVIPSLSTSSAYIKGKLSRSLTGNLSSPFYILALKPLVTASRRRCNMRRVSYSLHRPRGVP